MMEGLGNLWNNCLTAIDTLAARITGVTTVLALASWLYKPTRVIWSWLGGVFKSAWDFIKEIVTHKKKFTEIENKFTEIENKIENLQAQNESAQSTENIVQKQEFPIQSVTKADIVEAIDEVLAMAEGHAIHSQDACVMRDHLVFAKNALSRDDRGGATGKLMRLKTWLSARSRHYYSGLIPHVDRILELIESERLSNPLTEISPQQIDAFGDNSYQTEIKL